MLEELRVPGNDNTHMVGLPKNKRMVVLEHIKEITGERIPQNPWNCLFHGANKTIKQYKKTLVPFLLNAAKGLIPKKWLHTEKPSIREWLQRVDQMSIWSFCAAENRDKRRPIEKSGRNGRSIKIQRGGWDKEGGIEGRWEGKGEREGKKGKRRMYDNILIYIELCVFCKGKIPQ